MKTVVAVQDLLELEIKPVELLEEFKRLTEQALADDFRPYATFHVDCPACAERQSEPAFEKFGVSYVSCSRCASVFASPRPPQERIDAYYRKAPPSVFWRERVVPSTEAARAAKLARPRAEWVADSLAEHARAAHIGIDLSPHAGGFAHALVDLVPAIEVLHMVGATADLDVDDPPSRVKVRPGGLETLADARDMDFAVAFDALDRSADPRGLVRAVRRALRPGGVLFVIAPSITGFDLQVLWERSRAIMPPDRINLFSLRGFRYLFEADWDILELSTPGMFDVESVRRAMLSDPGGPWPRMLRQLLIENGPEVVADFQEFLQRHRLSSFARLALQRKD